jgi:cytosolic carboxypeptidase protein 2/3
VLNAMSANMDKCDVQESGCDLLWSLAFNDQNVKEAIASHAGASVVVRAFKRHMKSPEFVKSACGATSNICQHRLNQEAFTTHGGLQPLLASIAIHQGNEALLPFIFDAIASLIVNNEENAKSISQLGFIQSALETLSKYKQTTEIAKSGCHALAILSDIKGQASKIAFAGGVQIILNLLDIHPSFIALHRVAAVVLLRMLQESNHVSREIPAYDGVRILLQSLSSGGAQNDAVAAIVHMLFMITSPSNPAANTIEPQLWSASNETRLTGLLRMLDEYTMRRDIVRTICRFINNIGNYAGIVQVFDKLFFLEKLCVCLTAHRDSRDILECTGSVLKAINRRKAPRFQRHSIESIEGLLLVFRMKVSDDEIMISASDFFSHHIDRIVNPEVNDIAFTQSCIAATDIKLSSMDVYWEEEVMCIVMLVVQRLFKALREESILAFTKHSHRLINSLVACTRINVERNTQKINSNVIRELMTAYGELLHILQHICESPATATAIQAKYRDLIPLIKSLLQDYSPGYLNAASSSSSSSVTPTSHEQSKLGQQKIPTLSAINASPKSTKNRPNSAQASPQHKSRLSPTHSKAISVVAASSPTTPRHAGLSIFNAKPDPSPVKKLDLSTSDVRISETCKYPSSPALLTTWPSYLERLCPPSTPSFPSSSSSSAAPSSPFSSNTISSSQRMHVIYESSSAAGLGLHSRSNPIYPYSIPQGGIGDVYPHSLVFDSEFESGNLHLAVQRGECEYDLFLRPDLHTLGHTQWFYFSVTNTHPSGSHDNVAIKLNIVNLTKPDSLFNLGMRPVIYSMENASKGVGWIRAGRDVSYTLSTPASTVAGNNPDFYTLSFTLDFQQPHDTILIAYSYPYTLSDHHRHLAELVAKPKANAIIRRLRLCQSIAGNPCDLIILTDFLHDKERIGVLSEEYGMINPMNMTKKREAACKASKSLKPAVFLSARVHPGETPASYMMKGILDHLCSDHPDAVLMRSCFVFFIVPMLNPDGVLYGNNRCSLAGVDLNRQWKYPDRVLHPTIYHLKQLMQQQRRIREVYMYIDLHGHSRKYNVFMYGCDPNDVNSNSSSSSKKKLSSASNSNAAATAASKFQVRSFPRAMALHEVGRKYLSFSDCSFAVKKGREATARVVVARELGILYSYTIEATFCGMNFGLLKYCHMHIGHLMEVGSSLCSSILDFALEDVSMKDYWLMNAMVMNHLRVAGSSNKGLSIAMSHLDQANGKGNAKGGTIVEINESLLENDDADDESQSSDDENEDEHHDQIIASIRSPKLIVKGKSSSSSSKASSSTSKSKRSRAKQSLKNKAISDVSAAATATAAPSSSVKETDLGLVIHSFADASSISSNSKKTSSPSNSNLSVYLSSTKQKLAFKDHVAQISSSSSSQRSHMQIQTQAARGLILSSTPFALRPLTHTTSSASSTAASFGTIPMLHIAASPSSPAAMVDMLSSSANQHNQLVHAQRNKSTGRMFIKSSASSALEGISAVEHMSSRSAGSSTRHETGRSMTSPRRTPPSLFQSSGSNNAAAVADKSRQNDSMKHAAAAAGDEQKDDQHGGEEKVSSYASYHIMA